MPKLTLLLLSLTAPALTLALAGAALAGPAYRWTTADGSVAFSDDLKKIPTQYRASAERVGTRSLQGYPRYTPAQSGKASDERTAAMLARIERLREINGMARPAGAAAPFEGSPSHTILRLDDRTSLTIPGDRFAHEEPVVVEERRVRDRNNTTTTHVTVVRRGDEVLSLSRPESAHDRGEWGSERELFGDE
jgi:Domain of unknown function (DUF4124)